VLSAKLSYDNGTILIKGLAHIPFASIDPRTNLLRAPAIYYSNIIEFLKQSSIEYMDHVLDLLPSPHLTINDINNRKTNLSLRTYQHKALGEWTKAGMRGCIVLPTGSGKTIIGVKAIETVNSASIIVVPTLDLMDQWASVLRKYLIIHRYSQSINNYKSL
jgi:superfamily II DNA or RNA helicase